jgi:hypothetical protein
MGKSRWTGAVGPDMVHVRCMRRMAPASVIGNTKPRDLTRMRYSQ